MNHRIVFLCALFFSFVAVDMAQAQNILIKGIVVDQNSNSAIGGASILLTGTQMGTKSDNSGGFAIQVGPNSTISVSAIGYADTIIQLAGKTFLRIVLNRQSQVLGNVEVKSAGKAEPLPAVSQATQDDIVTGMLNDYARGAEFSNGSISVSGVTSFSAGPSSQQSTISTSAYYHTVISGFGPLNTINSGTTLPVINHKEDTRGSRYLMTAPVHGIVVDQSGTILKDSSYLLNFDKIDGKLLLTKDNRTFLEVDRDKVKAFALRGRDTSFVFLNVPLIDNDSYFILVAMGQHYSIYKSLKTKFTKADFQTNGLIEKGNNFDEYADNSAYYIVDYKKAKFKQFELKKKSLKEALADSPAGMKFMTDHRHDDIDEALLKGLGSYLNQD